MAASAVIGALRVNLGLDTATFENGLKKSQASLAKFGKMAAVGFAAVATAGVAASVAMGAAVKGAIDSADAMSKAAQKVGVATEALSRLKYAADYSDVSLEQLTGGLGRLSKTMLDVASGSQGPAATAFKALGIAVTDSAGKLRSSDAVFADIAERFAQLEDGSTKTALSMLFFGRAGADLIPLLNLGADGLASYAAESDKLGQTISSKTGRAAEAFNDTLTRIGKVMGGVVNKVMEAALPALQSLADTLASPKFAEAAQTLAKTMVAAFDVVVQAVVGTTNAIKGFFDWLDRQKPGNTSDKVLGDRIASIEGAIKVAEDKLYRSGFFDDKGGWFGSSMGAADGIAAMKRERDALLAEQNRRRYQDPAGRGASFGELAAFGMGSGRTLGALDLGSLTGSANSAAASVTDLMAGIGEAQPMVENFATAIGDSLAGAFSSFADSVLSGVPAVQALSDVIGDLGKQLLNSAISNFFGNLFGGGFGGGFSLAGRMPGTANLLNVGSFAGGGYTGSGPRSGGLDGMGGFPAILHPNETVIDHAAGQSMGGGHIAVSVSVGVQNGSLVPLIAQVSGEVAGRKIKQEAPAAVMAYQRNGGS
jgi:hypothetical protein